jgi:hypothetical protein
VLGEEILLSVVFSPELFSLELFSREVLISP